MDKDEPKKDEVADDISFTDEADIVSEEDEEGISGLQSKLKKLRQELKACQAEKQEYLAGWQRSKADYLNLKREEETKRAETSKYAKADVLNDLIQLADSFTMAFANKEAWASVPENWRKGVEYIHSQLLVVFRDHGLAELDPLGQIFDPATSESVGEIETDKKNDDDKVLEVIKKGYRLGDRVIRPAQVRIGQFKINN